MDSGITLIQTVLNMKDSGKKTNKTERESNPGQMEPPTKESINKARNSAMENLNGLMVLSMKDSS